MAEVVDIEVARKEVSGWLDYKKVKQVKRDTHVNNIEYLIHCVSQGDITIDDKTFVIKQKLLIPVDGLYSELEYKPRLNVGELTQHTSSMVVKSTDDAVLCAIAALTGKTVGQVKKLDTEDYVIATAIGVFFI